jgi:hypothetical protein
MVALSRRRSGRGTRRPPSDLRPVVQRLADEQELTLLVVAFEHQRYAHALAQLHPTKRELRSFYQRFSHDDSSDAGQSAQHGGRDGAVSNRGAISATSRAISAATCRVGPGGRPPDCAHQRFAYSEISPKSKTTQASSPTVSAS